MKQIFINLPVKDINASMEFYTQLGFAVNPLFTFEDQKCMVWSDQVYVMLQTIDRSKLLQIPGFTLPVESLDKLHTMIEKGLGAGGTEPANPIDEGFMQLRSIDDLDGYNWGIICLDLDKFKEMKSR